MADEFVQEIVTELLDDFGTSPLVIFGKGRGGWYCTEVLRSLGLSIACVADREAAPDELLNGVPVLNHENAAASFPDAAWVNSLLGRSSREQAHIQMTQGMGVRVVGDLSSILTYFMCFMRGRAVHAREYKESFELYLEPDNALESRVESPTLSCVLTEKCTLNCADCGAFVPDIDDPRTFSADQIVSDITNYCRAFDVVHHVALQGGEPLVHKDLEQVIEGVAAIPNLLFIDIVTNGTMVPRDPLISTLSKNGVAIWVSDYGSFSPKKYELARRCETHGVFHDCYTYVDRSWLSQSPIYPRGRTKEENTSVFRSCIENKYQCCQIMDGKLHRCSFSNFTRRLDYVPNDDGDHADLRFWSDQSVSAIRNVALRTKPLTACDYCPSADGKLVPAGLQVPRKKRVKHIVRSA